MHWLARVKYQSSDVIKIMLDTDIFKTTNDTDNTCQRLFYYLVLSIPKLCSYTEKIILKLKEDVRCLQSLDKTNVDSVDILTSKNSRPAKM